MYVSTTYEDLDACHCREKEGRKRLGEGKGDGKGRGLNCIHNVVFLCKKQKIDHDASSMHPAPSSSLFS